MAFTTILGLIAGILTSTAVIPQLIKTWKTKKAEDISLWMYIILCTGIVLWFVYGMLINDIPLMLANGVTLLLASPILYFKIKYG